MSYTKHERPKLNKDLNPKDLWVCVPKKSQWWGLGASPYPEPADDAARSALWDKYRISLGDESEKPKECWTCPCYKIKSLPFKCDPFLLESACRCDGSSVEPGKSLNKEGWVLYGNAAIEHARRVHGLIHRHLLKYKNVSAVDVGFAVQETDKRFINLLAIRIHVAKKRSSGELGKKGEKNFTSLLYAFSISESDPKALRTLLTTEQALAWLNECKKVRNIDSLARELEQIEKGRYPIPGIGEDDLTIQCCRLCICGVPLDIIESSYFPSAKHPGGDFESGVFAERAELSVNLPDEELELIGRGRVTPLVGGVSIGSVGGAAGTLGAVVWDCTDGTPCVLSNWHVLAGSPAAEIGQPTYQPALFDGGTTDDVVAHLKRWHLGEEGDAAIAELSDDRSYAAGEVLGLWHSLAGQQAPSLNLEIRKWGRTTGFTEGFIDGIHLATSIDYGNGLIRFFRDQFHIAPLYQGQDVSQVGDSGSLVVAKYVPAKWEDEKRKWETERQQWEREETEAIGILGQCLAPGNKNLAKDLWIKLEKTPLVDRNSIQKLATIFASIQPQTPPISSVVAAPGTSPTGLQATKSCDELAKCLEVALGKDLEKEPRDPIQEHLRRFLTAELKRFGFDLDAVLGSMEYRKELERRRKTRVYLAVGLIFAGDTPGSAFGEFALASDIRVLMEKLHFSLRPIFEPRSSFRRLRTRQVGRGGRGGGAQATVEPGDQRPDSRNQGPTPDGQSVLRGPASGGGP